MLLVGTVLPVSGTLIIDKTTSSNMSGNTLYVGGTGEGNYTYIQKAINDAVDGDTVFVYDDSSPYYEHVKVNKLINLIGENRETTVIDGGGRVDVVYISTDRVTVSGFTIQNSGDELYDAGIQICSNSNTITGNTITANNHYGIFLSSSSDNTITGNTISDNDCGICLLWESSNNNIIGNNITSNNEGIWLTCGFHCVVSPRKNTILKNNFLDNDQDASFYELLSFLNRNRWKQNYWNRPRILPKFIFGEIEIIGRFFTIPWINIDWNPAKEPYDI